MVAVDQNVADKHGDDKREPFTLLEDECWWRDKYDLIIQNGYKLRPRFRPGWTPSWKGTKKLPFRCEDGVASKHPKVMDAKRVSDGKRVIMKKLVKGSEELKIARFLTSDEKLKDPRNHCVPVLDVFSEEGSRLEYMVMPLFIHHTEPPFATVDEALDFVNQLLEGLVFLHEHGVAHRDCSANNIVMDGDPLFPKGFHPCLPILDAKARIAKPRRRRNTSGVKYYYIDFGLSSRFVGSEETRLVTGQDGLDREVPEINQPEPYDPFPVDIFILGNLFRKELTDVYENIGFLEPLVEKMTQEQPRERPTAKEALNIFNNLVQEQPPRSLRWALIYFSGTRFDRFIWTTGSLTHELLVLVKSSLSFFKRGLRKEK